MTISNALKNLCCTNRFDMVEVFSTNVADPEQAKHLVKTIQKTFQGYRANFDLADCDRILRIQGPNGSIQTEALLLMLKGMGVEAAVLPDLIMPAKEK
jgi:hypothetical protein